MTAKKFVVVDGTLYVNPDYIATNHGLGGVEVVVGSGYTLNSSLLKQITKIKQIYLDMEQQALKRAAKKNRPARPKAAKRPKTACRPATRKLAR